MIKTKELVAKEVLKFLPENEIIGVGSGSTVKKFIEVLANSEEKNKIKGIVVASKFSQDKAESLGIKVFNPSEISNLAIYVDGADEINKNGEMIKGGGAALTREKILASMSKKFICIADSKKQVEILGKFPLPVEIIPISKEKIIQNFKNLRAIKIILRKNTNGEVLITDNNQNVLDVYDLKIENPLKLEQEINNWAGVVSVGIFAQDKANIGIFASEKGEISVIDY